MANDYESNCVMHVHISFGKSAAVVAAVEREKSPFSRNAHLLLMLASLHSISDYCTMCQRIMLTAEPAVYVCSSTMYE